LDWTVETHDLTKSFSRQKKCFGLLSPKQMEVVVVDKVNLFIRPGEIFGLVGPNGAGKTTLVKMLGTLIEPSSGCAKIGGISIRQTEAVKNIIGLSTSDERSFYWRLTGRKNLEFFATLNGIPPKKVSIRVEEELKRVGLLNQAEKAFSSYSTGMRQRLSIARALLSEPKIIFLDEPTKGLDPAASRKVHTIIRDHISKVLGVTVFLTSHQLPEVETLCDRIAVMNQGRIQACGTMAELRNKFGPIEIYRLEAKGLKSKAIEMVKKINKNITCRRLDDDYQEFEFVKEQNDVGLGRFIDEIRENGGEIRNVTCNPISLSSIFDHFTQEIIYKHGIDAKNAQNTCCKESADTKLKNIKKVELYNFAKNISNFSTINKNLHKIFYTAKAFIRRDMLSEISYRFSLSMQFIEIMITVSVIYFLSQMLGQDAIGKYLNNYGGNYFDFVILGIAFNGFFNTGIYSHTSRLREAQTTGTLEAMLSTSTSLSEIILFSSLWDYVMACIRVFSFLMVGKLIDPSTSPHSNYFGALVVILLTVISASSIGILSASFIMVIKRGDPVTVLYTSLSFLLGGVMFPISLFPDWMQGFSLLLPTTHALQAIRLAVLQNASTANLTPQLAALVCFCAVLLPVSLKTFKYSVKRAKIEGSLTQY
jgi:ABC-type multidrug transport system ATPase subunit/ABC-type polysaccharide/polyol phosphate export permease